MGSPSTSKPSIACQSGAHPKSPNTFARRSFIEVHLLVAKGSPSAVFASPVRISQFVSSQNPVIRSKYSPNTPSLCVLA